jgi:hypothetical protein
VPASPALNDFVTSPLSGIAKDKILHTDLTRRAETVRLAVDSGATSFTLNSLIHLRCSTKDGTQPTTKTDAHEIRWVYTSGEVLEDRERQELFAHTLDSEARNLEASHKADLQRSKATLTQAGSLQAPAALWLVDDAITEVALPPDDLLHHDLTPFKVIPALCRRFRTADWALSVATRMAEGDVREAERQALYRYLTRDPNLPKKVWAALRKVPILRDHRGDWFAPVQLTQSSARKAEYLGPALHFPTQQDEPTRSSAHFGSSPPLLATISSSSPSS